jgi:hypothetical protein
MHWCGEAFDTRASVANHTAVAGASYSCQFGMLRRTVKTGFVCAFKPVVEGSIRVVGNRFSVPEPSHCITWQSPASWSAVGNSKPFALLLNPQTPALHVLFRQKVSIPSQSVALKHPAHTPVPSQNPLLPHGKPEAASMCPGTPPLHVPVRHAVP